MNAKGVLAGVGRIRIRRLLLAWLAVPILLVGCMIPTDASLYVSNHSGATFYLAVDDGAGAHLVSKVTDGAEGLALVWQSNGTRTVSVLDSTCKKLGKLEVQPDGSFALAAVPGLTASVEAHGERMGEHYADGAEATSDCGGGGYG